MTNDDKVGKSVVSGRGLYKEQKKHIALQIVTCYFRN